MARGLSEEFLNDLILNTGKLHSFLETVKNDDTLCLEIRDDYVNIYYRGGNLFKIEKGKNGYAISFDINYCDKYKEMIEKMKNSDVLDIWIEKIQYLKSEMDAWFHRNQKKEREIQQEILRENNRSSVANGTDYYIVDLEYADDNSRFDMLAIKWLSKASERKNTTKIVPVFIELKYGDKALKEKSGIVDHFNKLHTFLSAEKTSVYKEIETIFNQKVKLGLIDITKQNPITIEESANKKKPEFILIFVNHDPESKILANELKKIGTSEEFKRLKEVCDVKIATASFMGYGLYEDYMIPFDEFVKSLSDR
jgi:hypothetical protein